MEVIHCGGGAAGECDHIFGGQKTRQNHCALEMDKHKYRYIYQQPVACSSAVLGFDSPLCAEL